MSNELALNISKNIKRIKVNDEGEYITLNLDDQTFIPRLAGLMDEFYKVADEFTIKSAELDDMDEDGGNKGFEKMVASAELHLKMCAELKEKVDEAFQDEVCRKVFGDIVPSVAMFAEFFEQLGGLIKMFGQEKREKLDKYIDRYKERG